MMYLVFISALVMGPMSGDAKINNVPKIFYDLNEAQDLFDNFIIQFNKQYDEDEYEYRLAIFKDNLENINQFNKESNLTVYGITHFTDLKYEEVTNSYMGMRSDMIPHTDIKEYKSFGSAPNRLDYRESGFVTPVKNQGHCNSCYIFSAVGAIEGQHAKTHGSLVSLSEQQGLDCESGGSCQHGGYPTTTMQVLAQQGGSMSSEDYPYVTMEGECHTDRNKIVVKVTGGYQLSVNGEDDLKEALAEHGPLSIGLTVCYNFSQYRGGLFHYNCEGIERHAVLLVGYGQTPDSGTPYWIIKNSWDTVWGDEGYIYMEMGKGLCAIGSYVAVATVQ